MLFENQISNIRRETNLITRCLRPLEKLQLDMIDLRRLNLRQSAKALREAADKCDEVADRFLDPAEILQAAE